MVERLVLKQEGFRFDSDFFIISVRKTFINILREDTR